jgi:enoyl-CoA hydratase/carnithine racemase
MSHADIHMKTSEVVTSRDGHVAIISLNAPERLNTISGSMLIELSRQLVACEQDSDVRCVVLTGSGRIFCAGLDMTDQMAGGKGLGVLGDIGSGAEFDLKSAPPVVMYNMDTPIVCALNGGAAGYGLDITFGADIRIASSGAKLNPGFAKRGIVPESGGTWLLPRIVGLAKAAEIALVGKTLTAEEALTVGLVNHVVPADDLMSFSLAMAHEIAGNAPLATRAIKRMVRAGHTESFEQNVHHVYLQLLTLFRTHDFREGIASFLEKRTPRFEGR